MRQHRRAWISWDGDNYTGYVAELDEAGKEVGKGEDAPVGPDLADLLAWARVKASRIIVRPAWDPGVHYWAGDGSSPRDRYPLLPDSKDWPAVSEEGPPVDGTSLARCTDCSWIAAGPSDEAVRDALRQHSRDAHRA